MKIWERNYLAALIMFIIILNSGLFILASTMFTSELNNDIQKNTNEMKNIFYSVTTLDVLANSQLKIKGLANNYIKNNVYVSIRQNDVVLADTIPEEIKINRADNRKVIKDNDHSYLLIKNVEFNDNKYYEFTYLKQVDYLYDNQSKRIIIFVIVSILLTSIIGIVLYLTMKFINKPVTNIAHELRTPLTNIYGYSQYLLNDNIAEIDRTEAVEKVISESKKMQGLIEHLLIMGEYKGDKITRKNIIIAKVADDLKAKYPNLAISAERESIKADPTLFESLLDNLITNALRVSDNVKISFGWNKIIVTNDNHSLDNSIVKKMNSNKCLPSDRIQNHGYGIGLCSDIVKLHGWKLEYKIDAEDNLNAQVTIENCNKMNDIIINVK